MKDGRREFLKKSLKVAAVAGVATTAAVASQKGEPQSSGVVSGKIAKKEVLYYKSQNWEKYYKVAY
ncbi:Tat pathway signal protein [Campylobacter geochelonis]|uniref:Tat domain protein n=1 Tax=Campylobacter geochelonis TaxID=1780362 RepID=A0A128ELA6_9BACT|nr:Tat pathway signal protein [Campylobacter geochelonis]QKF72061.1 putative formate dehydrogenase-associated protein [Campylobacter geochelonis]CZE45823.1 tat domain protein [Campylobacter geochelonis]CZE46810.1 tat domain protein [Campylobacter geochelonis]CZE49851.1 tat domain protein [Campylobacter geochelonis]